MFCVLDKGVLAALQGAAAQEGRAVKVATAAMVAKPSRAAAWQAQEQARRVVPAAQAVRAVTGRAAADAELKPQDLILAIMDDIPEDASPEEKAALEKAQVLQQGQVLKDFDDLVQRLKKYREGDVIRLKVIRGRQRPFFIAPDLPPVEPGQIAEIVPVKLKGWLQLPVEKP